MHSRHDSISEEAFVDAVRPIIIKGRGPTTIDWQFILDGSLGEELNYGCL